MTLWKYVKTGKHCYKVIYSQNNGIGFSVQMKLPDNTIDSFISGLNSGDKYVRIGDTYLKGNDPEILDVVKNAFKSTDKKIPTLSITIGERNVSEKCD